MPSPFVLACAGSRFHRILAVIWLGLFLIVAVAPAMAGVKALPSGGWQFTGDDEAQELRAVLKSGKLNATIAFERDGR